MVWLSGIDAISHEETLRTGGKTIAVLGGGLNNIYPEENMQLYNEILEKGGLVITEYLPETKAESEKFLERNRIVTGIAIGILVIEAIYRSGTSVTARLAKEQGRKVFVLPHEIDDTHGVGTNQLLKKGAILVTSTQDIIEQFEFLTYKKIENEESKCNKRKVLQNLEYQKIYNIISEEPIGINEIYQKSNESISKINQILFMLEIEGYIQKRAGGYQCV